MLAKEDEIRLPFWVVSVTFQAQFFVVSTLEGKLFHGRQSGISYNIPGWKMDPE